MNQNDSKDNVKVRGQRKMLSFLLLSVLGVLCSPLRRKDHARLNDREVLDSNSKKGQKKSWANKFH